MAITIIEADLDNLSHQQALLMILDSYARDEMGQGYGLDVDVRNRVIAGLKEHGKSLVLLAYDDNEPIGSAVVIIGFSTFNARPLLNIHDLSVLPEFRGRGIGYKLLEAVEAKAKALDCCKLTLEVKTENERAYRLYKKYGFKHPGNGLDPLPTLFMEKTSL